MAIHRICSIGGCRKAVVARGLCSAHYNKARNSGQLEKLKKYKTCTVEGCDKPHDARGFCSFHYKTLYIPTLGPCSVDGCSLPIACKGLCGEHYREKRDSGLPTCVIDGCGRKQSVLSLGLCSMHARRHYKYGDPLEIKRTPNGDPVRFLLETVENPPRECVFWPFGSTNGYACVHYKGKNWRAHRLALILTTGQNPPPEVDCRHLCGNGNLGCINPRCLEWGTRKDNMADAIGHGRTGRGEASTQSILTLEDVLAIRSSSETEDQLAARYGISPTHAGNIRRGVRWAWLK